MAALILGFFSACQENPSIDPIATENNNSTVEKIELSPQALAFRDNLKDVSLLLSRMEQSTFIRQELQAATRHTYEVRELDEFIPITELLNPESAFRSLMPQQKASGAVDFSTAFTKALRTFEENSSKSGKDILEFIEENDVVIYFPYREDFVDSKQAFTYTYTPLDNDEENEGLFLGTGNNSQATVTVNDHYAQQNPTLIVGSMDSFSSSDFCSDPFAIDCGGGGSSGASIDNTVRGPFFTDGSPWLVTQLREMQLRHNFDNIFNGGSEIVFIFGVATVILEGQEADILPIMVTKNFSRSDANNNRWKTIGNTIHEPWNSWQITTPISIYEEDDNDISFLKSLNVKLDIPFVGEASVGFDFREHDSRDFENTLILNRAIYVADNKNDAGFGTRVDAFGQPVQIRRVGGDLQFTLPYRWFNF